MDKSTHEIRLPQWKQIIWRCQNRPKGQTVKQWTAENQIGEKSYYYWLRKIRKEAYEQLNSSTALPAVSKKSGIAFAEIPIYQEHAE